MNKYKSEVSTLLQNLLQYIVLRFEWQCLKRHTGKAGRLECIKASSPEELLGIKIASNLTFHDHITSLCAKANKKLSALSRVSKYMAINKRRILMKSYNFSQFDYYPLVWMCHSSSLNNEINRIQERALRIVYIDYNSNFKELPQKDKSITIHQKNLQYLAIEIYKVKMGIAPKIVKFCL